MVTSRVHSEVLNGGAEQRRVVAVLAAGLLASGSFVLAALGGMPGASARGCWSRFRSRLG